MIASRIPAGELVFFGNLHFQNDLSKHPRQETGRGREYYSERERDADNLTNALVCSGNLCPLHNSFTRLDTLTCTFVCLWDSWLDALGCTGKCCNAVFFQCHWGFWGEVGADSPFAGKAMWKAMVPLERVGQGLQDLLLCWEVALPHCTALPLWLFLFFFPSRMEQEMGMRVFFIYVLVHVCLPFSFE